ncbi:zinc-binding alcohol dehydrogenase family protein [Martelella alba]|uniref:Zinc-binding alcohol dehydrogenase family protein n=1 Tax=Martelella alba TaxID=2590451 RepID=A0A506UB62_9HYPH|nr:zinc-binding alcohol dehydrogenase family protein [Martelella alba]TPW30778.1 zinc-binding alcohol dehydrogenase family protein [Martelella alba]
MKAAKVTGPDSPPILSERPLPEPSDGLLRIHVSASAISQVTRSRAAGRHYSASAHYPFVPGVDGVGRTETGARVYFLFPQAPHGSLAEMTLATPDNLIPLPDSIDDVTAAALANPAMSSYAALTERARIQPGETVLINGATGTSGRLAVQIARHLGASHVIATGRNASALQELKALGADRTVSLAQAPQALAADIGDVFSAGIDIVLDYLFGPSAETILAVASKFAHPLRYVEIGAIAGAEITLPGASLRASAITMMGSGFGSVAPERLRAAIVGVFAAFKPAGLKIATTTFPLEQIEQAWASDNPTSRTVITVG